MRQPPAAIDRDREARRRDPCNGDPRGAVPESGEEQHRGPESADEPERVDARVIDWKPQQVRSHLQRPCVGFAGVMDVVRDRRLV